MPDPAWPQWLELVRLALAPAVVLPIARQAGLEVLFRLQVTARSMGALALNSGGLRLLGGGSGELPDLAAANGLGPPGASGPPPWLTVGFDVLGGRFAVNGGGLPGQPGEVCYWGPDTLAWTPLGAVRPVRAWCSAASWLASTGICAGPGGPKRWQPSARTRAFPSTHSCSPPKAAP